MNEYNCNSLKNLPVPEDLVERALAIPDTVQNTPAVVPWYRKTQIWASVASIALVTLAGISVFFFFGNKKPPIAKSQIVSDAVVPSEHSVTEPATAPSTDAGSEAIGADATQPATHTNASTPAAVSESEKTEAARASDPTAVTPSQGSTETPAPSEHAAKPTTEKMTDPPTERPTEQIVPSTEPTDEPWEPTDPTTEPTDEPSERLDPTTEAPAFSAQIRATHKLFHGILYCRIYDRTAKVVLGDPDRFAASHMAELIDEGFYIRAIYHPSEHGIAILPGVYAVAFYNENGENLYTTYISIE